MGILDEDVQRVREATDLVALAGEHIALKRVGRNVSGLCPFHQEKSPSFSISPDKGVWFCFGCQRSGDVITFIRELEHLDFVDAVRTHGCIDAVRLPRGSAVGGGEGEEADDREPPAKACPRCGLLTYPTVRECADCGFVFPEPPTSSRRRLRRSRLEPVDYSMLKPERSRKMFLS